MSSSSAREGPSQPAPGALHPPKAFEGSTSDVGGALAAATTGLVTKAEFTRRREEIESKAAAAAAAAAASSSTSEPSEKKKGKKKKGKAPSSTLSFADDDEAEDDEAEASLPKKPKKNPNVATDLLPDREREVQLQAKRDALGKEWEAQQAAIKAEIIEITYSFWDGKGHRNVVKVPKGFTVADFLNKCREQVRELRSCSPDQLIYVKEDLILPHGTTFYELIVNKARGKSGPLFSFDVHDDVRMVNDARVEKDESHAGKVMEKRLYERNKDKFPYSRFEVYDPSKRYDTYTIHGSETYGEGVNTALL